MKVQLERSFALPAGADAAWAFLRDVEAVTACMPGAKIVERIDAQHFKGTVAVRVGPASMAFKGTVEVRDVDVAQRSLRLVGKGTDSTGSSGASMDLLARIESVDAGTSTLVGNSTVAMSGRAATFGGRMMNSVADQVLKQFADNFALRVAALQAERAPPEAAATALGGSASDRGSAPKAAAPNAPPLPAPSSELNGLALIWAVLKGWLRDMFAGRKA